MARSQILRGRAEPEENITLTILASYSYMEYKYICQQTGVIKQRLLDTKLQHNILEALALV